MSNVMLDIETFSSEQNAQIIQVGAARFTLEPFNLTSEFLVNVDPACETNLLRDRSYTTMDWWKDQSERAKETWLTPPRIPLVQALESLTAWWPKGARAWAYAPTFDCAILINAYKQLGLKQPWHYRDEMDARTLKNITPKFGQEEVTEALRLAGRVNQWIEHYALHDAMSQALGVALSLQWLKENRW